MDTSFEPYHINATSKDLAGNDGIGRYIFLPGSSGRAAEIATHFQHTQVKEHPRGHHLYLGSLSVQDQFIDVAAIASGMGCPSMEIILHELFHLGAKRFLRVGTAGSLQPYVNIGDIINVQAAVRDERTTLDYAPLYIPALASVDFLSAILHVSEQSHLSFHTGIVHCKSSLYAREFGVGPLAEENLAYMQSLTDYGILASEMETAALFIQSAIYDQLLSAKGNRPLYRVMSGAVLGIISERPHHFIPASKSSKLMQSAIEIAIGSVKDLALKERE